MSTLLKRTKKMKNRKGFTLIELIVVIVIIGILAAILIPRLTGFTDKADATQAVVWAKEVSTAIDSFQAEEAEWPVDADIPELASLSGVDAAAIDLLATGGAFTVLYEKGDKNYLAGRDSADAPVEIKTITTD